MASTKRKTATAPDKNIWQVRALACTKGSKFGAIIRCAMLLPHPVPETEIPRFVGCASVTSDGYVMCNFVDRDGRYHYGAFVGALEDVKHNMDGLSRLLGLTVAEARELAGVMQHWLGG